MRSHDLDSQFVPPLRDVVLVGGGHSHVQVLKSFGMRPQAGVRLTLIAQDLQTPYSGMLPGCISGVYRPESIHIHLPALCHFAGARLIHAEVTGLDLEARRVCFAHRPALHYDLLSLNTGAVPALPHADALTVKPISRFLPKWQALKQTLHAGQTLVVVGTGAGGVELALAARRALPAGVNICLVGETLLPGHHIRARRRAERLLSRHDIEWRRCRARADEVNRLLLEPGDLPDDIGGVLWVTDVKAPQWLAQSGLTTDANGFVSVDACLRSVSHSNVFAAGDVAHLLTQPRPKSGVYAVRAGPVLTENLRRAVSGRGLQRYRAQANHLALIGDGHGGALASRGRWAVWGRFWWHLKDRIDRRFMRRFNQLPATQVNPPQLPPELAASMPKQAMRCGGCGAKLAADPLRRVLARLPTQAAEHVQLGMGDDAAVMSATGSLVLSIDGFRAMLDDPYLFGRIAAHHSLNDLYAMASRPMAALAFVTLPLMAEAMMEEELYQLLRGVLDVLNAAQVPLVGGHSAEGLELGIGLTVTGDAGKRTLLKQGACAGDRLLLTKPLGTGVILAAAKQGKAGVDSFAAACVSMDQSNAAAVALLLEAQVHALTDVTGFGLAGHLGEMLRASGVGAELSLADIPLLPGTAELLSSIESSLQQANELALQDFELGGGVMPSAPHLRALADPQTSGGLLAAVPANTAPACLQALLQAGYTAADIGAVTQGHWRVQ